jgi:uncharacterized protein YegP (UPF0339 family)
MKNVLNLFQDRSHNWRWSAEAGENGNVLADGGQGYEDRQDAINGFTRVATMGLGQVEVRVEGSDHVPQVVFKAYNQFKNWLDAWGVGYSDYHEDDGTLSLVLEEEDSYWILNFNADGSFNKSVPGQGPTTSSPPL